MYRVSLFSVSDDIPNSGYASRYSILEHSLFTDVLGKDDTEGDNSSKKVQRRSQVEGKSIIAEVKFP